MELPAIRRRRVLGTRRRENTVHEKRQGGLSCWQVRAAKTLGAPAVFVSAFRRRRVRLLSASQERTPPLVRAALNAASPRSRSHSCRASGRTARGGTSAPASASGEARSRVRPCRRDDTAQGGRASSTPLPIIRDARSLRPRTPSKLAGVDSACRSAATACSDRVSPVRVQTRAARAAWPRTSRSVTIREAWPSLLGSLLRLPLDLVNGIDHSIEGEQRRGMARVVIPYRLQNLEIRPFSFRRPAVFLQHLSHFRPDFAQLVGGRSDDV